MKRKGDRGLDTQTHGKAIRYSVNRMMMLNQEDLERNDPVVRSQRWIVWAIVGALAGRGNDFGEHHGGCRYVRQR